MLMLTFMVALFYSLMGVVQPGEAFLSRFPFPLFVPGRGWKEVDAMVYGNAITSTYGQWPWAVFQWGAYYGPYLTLVVWACLLAAAYRWKMGKLPREKGPLPPGLWRRCRGLLRSLGRPALAMSAFLLTAYLLAAPGALENLERRFQLDMAFARDPQAYWAEVTEAVRKVQADEKRMAEVRGWVEKETDRVAIPESEP